MIKVIKKFKVDCKLGKKNPEKWPILSCLYAKIFTDKKTPNIEVCLYLVYLN